MWISVVSNLQEILAVDNVLELRWVEFHFFISRAGRARVGRPAKKCWLVLVWYRIAEDVCGFEGLVEPEQEKQQEDGQ